MAVLRSDNGGLDQRNGDGKQEMLIMSCMQNPSDLEDLIQKTTMHEKGKRSLSRAPGHLGEWDGYQQTLKQRKQRKFRI